MSFLAVSVPCILGKQTVSKGSSLSTWGPGRGASTSPVSVRSQTLSAVASGLQTFPGRSSFASIPIHAHPLPSLPMQRKLAIGSVSDPLEQEADRIADRVVQDRSGHAPTRSNTSLRRCPCGSSADQTCENCKAKFGPLQRKAPTSPRSAEAPPIVHEVLRSPGVPLESSTRIRMERSFGRSLADVRIHTDARAAASAAAVNAFAYTVGKNVIFSSGRFRPDAYEGRRLLAHELAHVLQQTSSASVSNLHSSAVLSRSPSMLVQREACDDEGVCHPAGPPNATATQKPASATAPQSSSVPGATAHAGAVSPQIAAVVAALEPPGDCAWGEYVKLRAEKKRACDQARSCKGTDPCPVLLQKIANNQDCIKIRIKIMAKCFRGGDPRHAIALGQAINSLMNCWGVASQKCQPPRVPVPVPAPNPVPVPAPNPTPSPAPTPQPQPDEGLKDGISRITGLTGTALIIYLIISEGSRAFPPRNLIPAP